MPPYRAGLVPALGDAYADQTGRDLCYFPQDTQEALDRARVGGVDVVIAQAPELERQFVAQSFALRRHAFAANPYVLAGPISDPARIRGITDVVAAFRRIAERGSLFLTRGDRSGTHIKEIELWAEAGDVRLGEWYCVSDVGSESNAAIARDAAALGAYVLVDHATMVARRPGLEELVRGDPRLINVFAALPLNPRRLTDADGKGAAQFVRWLLDDEAQALIRTFGRAEYGKPLFVAAAAIPEGAWR